MTEDVSGGRLHLDAYVDTTGLTRGAQRRIDAEVRKANLRAKIRTELDTRGTIKQAKEAAAKSAAAAKVRIQTQIDQRGLVAQVKAACEAASQAARVKVQVEVDKASAAAAAATAAAVASDKKTTVKVDANTAPATAQVEAMRKTQARKPVSIPVKIDKSIGTALMQFSKIPAIVGGLYMLNSAIVLVGGGLVAMTGSAISAVSTLAMLPNLIGAIGTSAAALLIGFSGIGDALGALGAVEQETATSATSMADAHEAAAERIHAAKDSLRAANAAVEDSEWSLARAQESVTEAQENLNDAREAARDRIADLNRELRLSAGDEEAAYEALITAKENLQDVKWDKASSDQERRAAERAVKDARRAYNDTKRYRKDLREETREANKEGVKGSDEVESARDQLRDAIHSEQEAEEALAEARHSAADAQRALTKAQQDATEVTSQQTAAQVKLDDAFSKLSPAGQAFARFLYGLRDRWYELRNAVQQALLPPVQRGIQAALPLLDTLQVGLVGTARRIGGFVERLGGLFGRDAFNTDVAQIMRVNNRAIGIFLDAVFNLVQMFRHLAVVAGPELLIPFAKWVRTLTRGWAEAAKVNRESGAMADYFEKVRKRAKWLGSILGNLWDTLVNIGAAAGPTGDDLLRTFNKVTRGWAKWTGSEEGQARMARFFETAGKATKAVGGLVASLGKFFTKLAETGGGPFTMFVKTLTKMVDAMTWLISLPGIGPLVGWILTLSGAGGALGMVAGMFFTMYANLKRLKIIAGIAKLWRMFNMSLLGTRIGLAALWVQQKLVAAGSLMMRGAIAGLTLVMRGLGVAARFAFGPWGLAIMAVVGLFVLLYKKVDWFRAAVDWVWGKIVDGFNWVVDGAKWLWDVLFGHSIFPAIAKGFRWFGKIAGVVFAALRTAFRVVGAVFKVIGKVIVAVFRGLGSVARIIGKTILGVFKAIGVAVKTILWTPVKWVFGLFMKILDALGLDMGDLRDVAKKVWEAIKSALGSVWEFLRDKVFKPMADFVTKTIPDAFRDARDAIRGIWEDLKSIASKPIEFIINTLYNNGLRKMINALPGIPDLPEVQFEGFAAGGIHRRRDGGITPGYTPGRDVHRYYSPTGGRLDLSGGEAIMRPEWTRMVGARTVDFLNAAARRGKAALGNALGALGGQQHARGGIVGRFFKGGIMPLVGGVLTGEHPLPYYGTGATFAGDINSPGDLASPPSAVKAWRSGVVAQVNQWATSYGNHVLMNHGDGSSSLYAHLSSIIARIGQQVGAGGMLGRVGQTGNAYGAHLHFEIRGGTAATGTSAAASAGQEEESSWRKAISTVKDVIGKVPEYLRTLSTMGEWGGVARDVAGSIGRDLVQWINDKIPNSISIPGPNIPLPDNPIPNIFDRGGQWLSGTMGMNLSGKTETVFTNQNMVDIAHDLAVVAASLRGMVENTRATGAAGTGALVENLTLVGTAAERRDMWREVNDEFRVIKMGGVHVQPR